MKCEGIKADGARCSIVVADGASWCLWHDPSQAGRRRVASARKRGGKASAKKKLEGRIRTVSASEAPDPPKTLEDIAAWLGWATHSVATGALDARTADTIGKLLTALRGVIEKTSLADEIEALKTQLAELRRGSVGVVR